MDTQEGKNQISNYKWLLGSLHSLKTPKKTNKKQNNKKKIQTKMPNPQTRCTGLASMTAYFCELPAPVTLPGW